jgi:flagellum-specific ATP synthase
VLVDGDDPNEPVADTLRGLLDGHIVLSREIAQSGVFPAVDVLHSLSRLMPALVDEPHARAATFVRACLSAWRDGRDLVEIGAYKAGSNRRLDVALSRLEAIRAFLRQGVRESTPLAESMELLALIAEGAEAGA